MWRCSGLCLLLLLGEREVVDGGGGGDLRFGQVGGEGLRGGERVGTGGDVTAVVVVVGFVVAGALPFSLVLVLVLLWSASLMPVSSSPRVTVTVVPFLSRALITS